MSQYKVKGKDGIEIHSDVVLHPGEVLRTELEARKLPMSAFAMDIKVYPSHFSDVLRGKRNINAALAIKLEKALGISAGFWIRIQGEYDLQKEKENRACLKNAKLSQIHRKNHGTFS